MSTKCWIKKLYFILYNKITANLSEGTYSISVSFISVEKYIFISRMKYIKHCIRATLIIENGTIPFAY